MANNGSFWEIYAKKQNVGFTYAKCSIDENDFEMLFKM